jgi:hypothetical protein
MTHIAYSLVHNSEALLLESRMPLRKARQLRNREDAKAIFSFAHLCFYEEHAVQNHSFPMISSLVLGVLVLMFDPLSEERSGT